MQRAAFHTVSQNTISRIQVFMGLFHQLIATKAKNKKRKRKKCNGRAASNIYFDLGDKSSHFLDVSTTTAMLNVSRSKCATVTGPEYLQQQQKKFATDHSAFFDQ